MRWQKDKALAELTVCEHLLAIFLFIAGRGKQSTLTRMVRRSIISLGTYRGRLLDDEARASGFAEDAMALKR